MHTKGTKYPMANKTAERLLSDLLDREAIHDVVVRYYDAVWRDDVAGLVDLYTEDGTLVLKYKEEKKIAGRDALLKFYRESMGATNPRPYCHNHVVDLHGNGRASGRCYTERRSGNDFTHWLGASLYEDEYVKVGDQWKFRSRVVIPKDPRKY
jgi:ketosteroid isomerase-like protein